MIVIADSTPLHYLILIHQVDLLPQLFDRILIPPAVFEELQHQETPDVVRRWIASTPSWLQVQALRSVGLLGVATARSVHHPSTAGANKRRPNWRWRCFLRKNGAGDPT
jgi:predicted nucleic acid-binding protein